MGTEIPVCPLCLTPRMPRRKRDAWFWGCQNYPTCTAPTTTNPPEPLNLQTLLLKQKTQAVNDMIPAKGCRHLLVKPWATGTGKGNTCQLCGAITNNKGDITGTSKSVQRKLVNDEGKQYPNRTMEGRTELDLVQDEVDEAKRLLEEAHVEVQAAKNKVTEAAFRAGQAMEDVAQIKKLLEANSEPAGFWEASGGQKPSGENGKRPSWKRRNSRTSGYGMSIPGGHNIESACSSTARPFDLRGGTFRQHPRVLVATVDYQEKPHLCMQILHAAVFQVSRGAYILLRLLSVTDNQETQWLLDEIQRQPSVYVLSGPATVITNIAAASALLAGGWSTETVSRVVRTARTRRENHEREHAQHVYYSHTHDRVTISDAFPVTGQGFNGRTTAQDDQEDETEQSSSESLQTRRQILRIHENMGHT